MKAVLLVQLGTPDKPEKADVKRYLKEFLNDPRVIDFPTLKRTILVNGIIIPARLNNSTEILYLCYSKNKYDTIKNSRQN